MNMPSRPTNPPPGAARDPRADTRWRDVLTATAAAGHADGINTAAWWQQDTIGGRTTGDPVPTARRTLAGLDDIDPQVIDSLPPPDLDETHMRELHDEHTDPDTPAWDDLNPDQRAQARDAYLDAFHTAVQDTVAGHCRDLLDTTTADATAAGTPANPARPQAAPRAE